MTPVKFYQNRIRRNVENSETGPNSKMLISNTREPVELSFKRLSFIESLGAEVPVRCVEMKSPIKLGV